MRPKACEAHNVQSNIIFAKRQTLTLFSSQGELRKQRSSEDGFSGLIGLRERNPVARFRLIVI